MNMISDDDEFDDCSPLDDDCDDGGEDKWECIGKDCLNPHFIHLRAECYTLEMCEDNQEDIEDHWSDLAESLEGDSK